MVLMKMRKSVQNQIGLLGIIVLTMYIGAWLGDKWWSSFLIGFAFFVPLSFVLIRLEVCQDEDD